MLIKNKMNIELFIIKKSKSSLSFFLPIGLYVAFNHLQPENVSPGVWINKAPLASCRWDWVLRLLKGYKSIVIYQTRFRKCRLAMANFWQARPPQWRPHEQCAAFYSAKSGQPWWPMNMLVPYKCCLNYFRWSLSQSMLNKLMPCPCSGKDLISKF